VRRLVPGVSPLFPPNQRYAAQVLPACHMGYPIGGRLRQAWAQGAATLDRETLIRLKEGPVA